MTRQPTTASSSLLSLSSLSSLSLWLLLWLLLAVFDAGQLLFGARPCVGSTATASERSLK